MAELSCQGLPVPPAVVISAEAFTRYRQTGQIDHSLLVELESIRNKLGGKVALRSSASCEDGNDISMAGVFETYYLQSADQTISSALQAIYDQAQSAHVREYLDLQHVNHGEVEMAVILQQLIEPDLSGVVYTDVDGDQLLVQYTSGFGNQLVDGETDGSTVLYQPNQEQITKSKNTDIHSLSEKSLQTLAKIAAEIKLHFSGLPQDIEFAIKDNQIYILQARSLTAEIHGINLEMSHADMIRHVQAKFKELIAAEKDLHGIETVVFSDSNFSELLPHPKEMDFGVFAYIFTGSDGVPGAIQLGRQQMGYQLGDESVGFMHYVGGKPYFSIAGDAHTFYAGFPDDRELYTQTLVKDYVEAVHTDPEKGKYPEMGLYLQDPSLIDLADRYGQESAKQYYQRYLAFKRQMAECAASFMGDYSEHDKPATDQFIKQMSEVDLQKLTTQELASYAIDILEHLRTVSCVHFVKSARLGFYYSQRLQNMLTEYFGMDTDAVAATFVTLNQGLDNSEITAANLEIAKADSYQEAFTIGKDLVGHYSTGEMLEIRHPRLKDDESALASYVEGIYSQREQYVAEFTTQRQQRMIKETQLLNLLSPYADVSAEFEHVLHACQTYMSLRETVKYQFVKEYALLRDALMVIAKETGVATDDIFSLFPRELETFITNPARFTAQIAERQERFTKNQLLDLPSVVREIDVDQLGTTEFNDDRLELFGKLLAHGQFLAEAIIVNIEDFETVSAAREVLLFYRQQALPIVLVAAQMNLSHDPLIVQAEGLVIENAGLVSHGAQRARELGRGAIGGIRAKSLKTGEVVLFDPDHKKVVKKRTSL